MHRPYLLGFRGKCVFGIDFTYSFDSVVEYMKHGADNKVLNIHIIINSVRDFFREFRRCSGRTIAT